MFQHRSKNRTYPDDHGDKTEVGSHSVLNHPGNIGDRNSRHDGGQRTDDQQGEKGLQATDDDEEEKQGDRPDQDTDQEGQGMLR